MVHGERLRWSLLGAAGLALLAVAVGGDSISPKALYQKLNKKGRTPLVVDVRSSMEYRRGHVPGALHLPLWSVPFKRRQLPSDGRPVVVYCEAGPRAVLARGLMLLVGVRPVDYLDGHMAAWRRAGLPVEK